MCVSGSRLRCRLQDSPPPPSTTMCTCTMTSEPGGPRPNASDLDRTSYAIHQSVGNFRRGVGKFHNPFTLYMLKAMPFCKLAQTRHWPFRFSPFCGKIFPQYCPADRFSRQTISLLCWRALYADIAFPGYSAIFYLEVVDVLVFLLNMEMLTGDVYAMLRGSIYVLLGLRALNTYMAA